MLKLQILKTDQLILFRKILKISIVDCKTIFLIKISYQLIWIIFQWNYQTSMTKIRSIILTKHKKAIKIYKIKNSNTFFKINLIKVLNFNQLFKNQVSLEEILDLVEKVMLKLIKSQLICNYIQLKKLMNFKIQGLWADSEKVGVKV